MHDIYRKAKGVYIWLGRAHNGSDEAISAINKVTISEDDKSLEERLLTHRSGAVHLFDVALFKPIAALSRRSWFQRLWIAQEYLFAQSTTFICGNGVIDGKWFIEVLMKLTIHSFGAENTPTEAEAEELFIGFNTLRELEKTKDRHMKSKAPILLEFVTLNRERLGKEPVDKIYAAFGMAMGDDEIYRKKISINYSERAKTEYWNLYAQFGKVALMHEPKLELLSMVSSKERPEHLPSWCPNFNATAVTSDMDSPRVHRAGWPWPKHGGHFDSQNCIGHPHFKGEDACHVTVSVESNVVSIWGASLGRIKAIACRCEWTADIDMQNLSAVKSLSEEFLKWVFRNEAFCTKHIGDEDRAFYVNEQVLVGATSDARRMPNLKPSEEKGVLEAGTTNAEDLAQNPVQAKEACDANSVDSPDMSASERMIANETAVDSGEQSSKADATSPIIDEFPNQ